MNCVTVAGIVFLSCCSFFGLPVRLSRSWILQLQLSLGLTALVRIWEFKAGGENYRSKHVGTGRMWLLETTQPGDRSQKKKKWYEFSRPAMWWMSLICCFLLKCIWLGVFQSKVKFELFLIHYHFWVIDHSEMSDAIWEHLRRMVARIWAKRDAWVTETLQWLLPVLCPEGQLWACRGGWKQC